jgi:hypothetical protein
MPGIKRHNQAFPIRDRGADTVADLRQPALQRHGLTQREGFE